jgi:hypothetical protein
VTQGKKDLIDAERPVGAPSPDTQCSAVYEWLQEKPHSEDLLTELASLSCAHANLSAAPQADEALLCICASCAPLKQATTGKPTWTTLIQSLEALRAIQTINNMCGVDS